MRFFFSVVGHVIRQTLLSAELLFTNRAAKRFFLGVTPHVASYAFPPAKLLVTERATEGFFFRVDSVVSYQTWSAVEGFPTFRAAVELFRTHIT